MDPQAKAETGQQTELIYILQQSWKLLKKREKKK